MKWLLPKHHEAEQSIFFVRLGFCQRSEQRSGFSSPCNGATWPREGARSDSFPSLLPVPQEALPPRRRQPLPAAAGSAAAAVYVPRGRTGASRSISSLSRKCPERKWPPSGGCFTGSDGPPRPSRRGRCSQPALRSPPRLRPAPPCPAARRGPRGAERSGRAAQRSCEYRARAARCGPARRSPPPGGGRRGVGNDAAAVSAAALPGGSAGPGTAEQGATRQVRSRRPPPAVGGARPREGRGHNARCRAAASGRCAGEAPGRGWEREGRPSVEAVTAPPARGLDGAMARRVRGGRERLKASGDAGSPSARRFCIRPRAPLSCRRRCVAVRVSCSVRSGLSAPRGAVRLNRLCWQQGVGAPGQLALGVIVPNCF